MGTPSLQGLEKYDLHESEKQNSNVRRFSNNNFNTADYI